MNQNLEDIRDERKEKVAGIFKYFSLIMGVFYMIMGVIFYLFPFLENIESWAKISISLVLFLYGFFRLWRAWNS
jgi:hypothetical protein